MYCTISKDRYIFLEINHIKTHKEDTDQIKPYWSKAEYIRPYRLIYSPNLFYQTLNAKRLTLNAQTLNVKRLILILQTLKGLALNIKEIEKLGSRATVQ